MSILGETLLSVVVSLCVVLQLAVAYPAATDPPFSYDPNANNGPANWYKLPGYGTCAGKNQSPINILTRDAVRLRNDLRIYNYDNYQTESMIVRNNGHYVNVDFNYGTTITLNYMPYISGGQLTGKYKLINIHFHWGAVSSRGSEHTFNGQRSPIEAHLVHIKSNYDTLEEARQYKDGVAVIGSMYKITTSDNSYLRNLLTSFQSVKYKDQTAPISRFNIYDVLPNDYEYYYSYFGSLTTPPCSESVSWNVFENAAPISEAQMRIFRSLQHETRANDPNNNMPMVDNFRPLQNLNGRTVYWQPQY